MLSWKLIWVTAGSDGLSAADGTGGCITEVKVCNLEIRTLRRTFSILLSWLALPKVKVTERQHGHLRGFLRAEFAITEAPV